MRTPLEPRRSTVSLTVASPTEPTAPENPRIPYVPWLVAALVWTACAALLGFVVVGLFASVSWLTAIHLAAADVFATIGQGWLALHGAAASIGGVHLGMVPLGLALLVAAACAFAAHHAAGQYDLAPDAPPRTAWLAWAGVTGAGVGAYFVVGVILAAVLGGPAQLAAAVPGLVLLPLVGCGVGAFSGLGLEPLAGLPEWVRRLPGAAGLGLAVLLAGGLLAGIVALVAHWPQVAALHDSLQPDTVGAVVLTLVQLAYLPNLIVWAGSFALGAGVSLGGTGVVAPGVAIPTVLPAIPVLGAVPGVPGVADWAWPLVGVAAGAASAWWRLRQSAPEWQPCLWQGAVAGVAPGLGWLLLAWLSTGDLGVDRLVGFGPRFPDLLLWATLPLALAGGLYGVGRALWLSRRAPAAEDAPTG